MRNIEVKLSDEKLVITKIRARQTIDDKEEIALELLEYDKIYTSKIKVTSTDFYNRIFLFQPIDNENNILTVFSDNNKIKYSYCSIESAYKSFIQFKHKTLSVSLSKKKLKVCLIGYLVNKYGFDIKDTQLYIDQSTHQPCGIYQADHKLSLLELLRNKTIHKFKFDLDEILNDDSEVNGKFHLIVNLENAQIPYGIGKREKNLKNKRYYYAPIKSVFKKEFALHIRRTTKGNLTLVKRLKEPFENTLKFKIMESKFVSNSLYFLSKILLKLREKPINLYYEKFSSKAEEGAYDLFLLSQKSESSKNYFIIDKASEDFEKIKSVNNVVAKYSIKYYWLLYNASNFISTEAPIHLNILRSNNKAFRKSTCDKKFVFLQHGVTYLKCQGDRSTFTKNKEGEPTYIIVGSEKEKDVVVDMLKINDEQVLNTGLPIFSKTKYNHINNSSDDIVTIMLTWKPYEEQLYSFEESTYYQNTIKIFDILKNYISAEKIIVIPHPKVLDLIQTTSLRDSIWTGKISEVLEKTKLLITDYSSVCYNTFYQGGAVIFYQEDIEKYELENGKLIPNDDEYIGKRVFNLAEFENIIYESINDQKIDLTNIRTSKHEANYKTINEFSDGKNIERIFEKLQELKLI